MYLYVMVYMSFILLLGIYIVKTKTHIGHVFLRTEVVYWSIFHSSKKVETMSGIMAAYVIAQSQHGQ